MADFVNPNNDIEVVSPPGKTVSAMEFSPATMQKTFFVAGGWDKSVRFWEVQENGQTLPKSMQSMTMPIFDVCWNGDGTKVFMASSNNHVESWDLERNQTMLVATHDAPVISCHWVVASPYTCIMTGSWDGTLKFWDLKSPGPILNINVGNKVYCADVIYPYVVVSTESNNIITYNLEKREMLESRVMSPLKYLTRCVAIYKDKITQAPTGFGLGNIGGGTAIFPNFKPDTTEPVYLFDSHYRTIMGIPPMRSIYSVNDIKFHPIHNGSFATVGADATFAFWDMESQTRLKKSEILDLPITKCCFNSDGRIFAYSPSVDCAMGISYLDPDLHKPRILLRSCVEELKPKLTTQD